MKPKKKIKTSNNSVYEKAYDTSEEAKLSRILRMILNNYTVHIPIKKVKMLDPDFASTDALKFVLTYYKKKFVKKLLKTANTDEIDYPLLRYLPLEKTELEEFANNAAYAGNKFIYNGRVAGKFFPTFADVMAHEVGHQLDRNTFIKTDAGWKLPSFAYQPFTANNSELYNIRKYSKNADKIIEYITNDRPETYDTYHDAYPSELFADIIADKYRMNVYNIYNSLGSVPFTQKDYKNYMEFLENTTNFPWSRGMYRLIKPGQRSNLPDAEIYTKAMNDL